MIVVKIKVKKMKWNEETEGNIKNDKVRRKKSGTKTKASIRPVPTLSCEALSATEAHAPLQHSSIPSPLCMAHLQVNGARSLTHQIFCFLLFAAGLLLTQQSENVACMRFLYVFLFGKHYKEMTLLVAGYMCTCALHRKQHPALFCAYMAARWWWFHLS